MTAKGIELKRTLKNLKSLYNNKIVPGPNLSLEMVTENFIRLHYYPKGNITYFNPHTHTGYDASSVTFERCFAVSIHAPTRGTT